MVFYVFVSDRYPRPGAKHLFVGKDAFAVVRDTNLGNRFGFAEFLLFDRISYGDAVRVAGENLHILHDGMTAVADGLCESFFCSCS